jgi:hypothetical protein
MPNDRVVVGVQAWNVAPSAFYEANDAGAFNQTTNGNFSAYVTFWLQAGYLTPTLPADSQFLWGNLIGNTGWAIHLTAGAGGQAVLRATFGNGAALFNADCVLSSATAQQPAFIERLIQAVLFLDSNGRLSITVNGSLTQETESASAVAGSPAAARLGCAPDSNTFALHPVIVSCGYYAAQLNVKGTSGIIFRNARATLHYGTKLDNELQVNWTHRYDLPFEMAVLPKPSASATTPFGFTALGAAPPVSLTDQGGDSPFVPPIFTGPVALVRGPNPTPLFATSAKNPDWYAGGGFNLYAP